jgi:electron transfer flavoprotein alpha subunit
MAKALVLAETADAQRILSAGARTIADAVVLVTVGTAETGVADKAYQVEVPADAPVDNAYDAIQGVFDTVAPDVVLIEPTLHMKTIGGKLAAKAGASIIANITALDGDVATNLYFGGLAAKQQKATSDVKFYTTNGALFGDAQATGTDDVETVAYVAPANALVLKSTKDVPVEGADLTKSDVIVAVGRGFAEENELDLAKDLAGKLGADLGCSRPVAENLGWMPRNLYVGVSGVQVNPKAYVAVGISGQMQHMVGCQDSKAIFAINKDANAPIFKQCDYGLVADLTKVLPELTAKLG